MNITSAQNFRPAARAAQPAPAPSAPAPSAPAGGDTVTIGQQQPPCEQQPAPPAQQQPAPPTQPQPGNPGNGGQVQPKEWTVLVYSVSDNNLYEYMQEDLDEAERVGSTNEMNVLVETSHQPQGGNVVRMKLEADDTPGLKSPVVQDLGKDHDMAQSDNLANAIAWAMKEYPAKHTMVILSDHGGGWMGANQSESHDSWMNISDIEAGFKKAQELTGKKVDVIGFDECLMASTETAHQIRDCANYMVGSEEVEGGAGWQYDQALGDKESQKANRVFTGQVLNYAAAALRARDPLTPADMAKGIVQMAEGHQRDLGTMSAIDLSKMSGVTQALDNFAGVVLDSNLTKKDFADIKRDTQKFYEYADMGHFVELAGKKFGGAIGEAADQVKAAMSEAVIAEQHSSDYPNAKGLNIEINKNYGMHGGNQTGAAQAGGALSDQEMQQLVQLMVMAMSPEQLGQLYAVMPQIMELNAQFHAQAGGGEGQQVPPEQSQVPPTQNGPSQAPNAPKYDVPNMDPESQKRVDFAPYEATAWAQDTRWDEMLQKVC